MVLKASLNVAAIIHAKTTHMTTEEAPASGGCLQARAVDRECQAARQTFAIPALRFRYVHESSFIRRLPV